jgi:hypothetical protein
VLADMAGWLCRQEDFVDFREQSGVIPPLPCKLQNFAAIRPRGMVDTITAPEIPLCNSRGNFTSRIYFLWRRQDFTDIDFIQYSCGCAQLTKNRVFADY